MRTLRVLPASLVSLLAVPAFADVTAQDVWNELKSIAESTGMSVQVDSQDASGGALTLGNVRYRMDSAEFSMAIHVDQMRFDETGDGRVKVTMSDVPVAFSMKTPEGNLVEAVLDISLPGQQTVYSGTPGAMSSEVAAPLVLLTLQDFKVDGKDIDVEAAMRMANFAGTYQFAPAIGNALPTMTTRYTAESLVLDADMTAPEGETGHVTVNATFHDLAADTTGSAAAMQTGGITESFQSTSNVTRGPSEMTIAFEDGDQTVNAKFHDTSGFLMASILNGVLDYSGGSSGTEIALSGSAIPLPSLELALAASQFAVALPILPSDKTQAFRFKLALEGLSPGAMLWSMFDPGGQLPHDPADLVVALSGEGKLSVDVFNPAFDPQALDSAPGEIGSVSIDEISLSALGAHVSAAGKVENQAGSAEMIPVPVGSIDISIAGVEKLMQTLGSMGLVPPEQAGMAQMMMGMFAVPGPAPDTYNSHIEFTPEGGILANGMPLR